MNKGIFCPTSSVHHNSTPPKETTIRTDILMLWYYALYKMQFTESNKVLRWV